MHRIPLVVRFVSFMFSFSRLYSLPPAFHIGKPEYGPGAIFGASGVYTSSASASSSGSPSLTPSKGRSSSAGPIASGVVGGIAVFSIAVAAIIYLLRHSKAQSARPAVFDGFQTHKDEIPRPLSDEGMVERSSPSVRIKFSVRYFSSPALHFVCPVVLPSYLLIPRICRMNKLCYRGTVVHTRWTSLLQDLHHRTLDQEAT